MQQLVSTLVLILLLTPTDAFVSHPLTQKTHSLSSLSAKRTRRRRKEAPEPAPSSPVNDDLPDFDLDEDGSEEEAKPAPSMASMDEISTNMMGSSDAPVRSISELVADRSLESKFQFDESQVDPSIPDLAELARNSQVAPSAEGGRMSKSARNEARREAARARDAAVEDEKSFLEKIPFITNEKGEVAFNLVLEAGAWLGIALLVLWEVYINSPFFERAAPMAPVVY